MTLPIKELSNIIEAALFSSETPLTIKELQLLFVEDARPTLQTITKLITQLGSYYEGRGIELIQIGNGYRFQTCGHYGKWLNKLYELRPPRYSKALLETLAIIAYRQPVTRGDIEDIRGVTVTTEIMRSLLDREWVRQSGFRQVPGRPALYSTTHKFLEYFGLTAVDDLPNLDDPREIAQIMSELDVDGEFSVDADTTNDKSASREVAHEGTSPGRSEANEETSDSSKLQLLSDNQGNRASKIETIEESIPRIVVPVGK